MATSAFSRWMQHMMNARLNRRIRAGRGGYLGMEVLILHTVGRRSGHPRQTPVAWFADGDEAWLVVASGGGSQNPDWHANLMARPEQVSVEMPARETVPVRPLQLTGPARDRAWQVIATANPRMAKYQSKSDREYPIIRLSPR